VRPIAVLNAILFGSAAAIAFGLCGILVVFLILQGRHPEIGAEIPLLWRSGALFAMLAALSGVSLFGVIKKTRWRCIAQVATWLLVAGITAFYV
jgi:hypothetical protein